MRFLLSITISATLMILSALALAAPDPANGREYKALLSVDEADQTLRMRGFIGFSLIGRTQVWERVQ